jgi:hypothetical protein
VGCKRNGGVVSDDAAADDDACNRHAVDAARPTATLGGRTHRRDAVAIWRPKRATGEVRRRSMRRRHTTICWLHSSKEYKHQIRYYDYTLQLTRPEGHQYTLNSANSEYTSTHGNATTYFFPSLCGSDRMNCVVAFEAHHVIVVAVISRVTIPAGKNRASTANSTMGNMQYPRILPQRYSCTPSPRSPHASWLMSQYIAIVDKEVHPRM